MTTPTTSRASIWRTVTAGYVAVVVLLAGGMAFTIDRFNADTIARTVHIRAEEMEITRAERLRWTGEVVVSLGRGYLLSGHSEMLARLRQAEADFDRGVVALRNETLSPAGLALVSEVERAAGDFRQLQEQLIQSRQPSQDVDELVARFDELVSLRRELSDSLDRFVHHEEAAIGEVYDQADRYRRRLALRMYGLLAVLLLVGLVIAAFFSRLLVRARRKEAEALETATKAVAARDELMAIVAHDLRNPLGAISLKAALVRRGNDPEKMRSHAASIENVTLRMEYLVKSMLDIATMEAGHFSVTPAPCDVEDLLRQTFEMFGSISASKQIRLVPSVNEPRLAVRADRERILEVLSNLLGNALKFTPPGGEVSISVDRQRDMVHFVVSDTGPGIPAERIPHVFERFWKRDTDETKGTGLGLFIAKGIIDAHGGRIWAESQPNRGATFTFTLPIASNREDERAADIGVPAAHP